MPLTEAVGISSNVHKNKLLAKRIEAAMQKAILDANAEGISTSDANSAELSARMHAARQSVIEEVCAAEAEFVAARQKLADAVRGEGGTI